MRNDHLLVFVLCFVGWSMFWWGCGSRSGGEAPGQEGPVQGLTKEISMRLEHTVAAELPNLVVKQLHARQLCYAALKKYFNVFCLAWLVKAVKFRHPIAVVTFTAREALGPHF